MSVELKITCGMCGAKDIRYFSAMPHSPQLNDPWVRAEPARRATSLMDKQHLAKPDFLGYMFCSTTCRLAHGKAEDIALNEARLAFMKSLTGARMNARSAVDALAGVETE